MTTDTDDTRLVTLVLVIVGALLVLPVLFVGFGMMGHGSAMGGMWGGGMWADGTVPGWMLAVSALTRLLFLAVLAGGAYLVYRAVADESGSDPALDELRRAYARGDLTDEEYENRRERLERNG